MDIKQELESSLPETLRSGDENRKRVVRLALSNLKFEEKNKGRQLSEAEQISILQKEVKVRKETIEGAERAGRADMVSINLEEIKILEEFLPKQLTENEMKLIIEQAIDDVHASGPQDIGKVIKIVIPVVQGRASNDMVSKMVKEILSM